MSATTATLEIRNQLATAAIQYLATKPSLTDLHEKAYYLKLIVETNLALLLWKTDAAYAAYRVTGPKGDVTFNWPAWAYDNNFLVMPGIDFENQAAAVAAFKELHDFNAWRNGAIVGLPGYPRIDAQYYKNVDVFIDGKTVAATFADVILYFANAQHSETYNAGGNGMQLRDILLGDANWKFFNVTNASVSQLSGKYFVFCNDGGTFTNSVLADNTIVTGNVTYRGTALYNVVFAPSQTSYVPGFIDCTMENVSFEGTNLLSLTFRGEVAPKNLSCRGLSFHGYPTTLGVLKEVGKDGLTANLSGADFSKAILNINPLDIPLFVLTAANFSNAIIYNPANPDVPMQGSQIADYFLNNGMSQTMVNSIKGINTAPQLASKVSTVSVFQPAGDDDNNDRALPLSLGARGA